MSKKLPAVSLPASADGLAGFAPGLLATACVTVAKAGTTLFRTDDIPDRLYFVKQGEALLQRVTAAGDRVILQRASNMFLADASVTALRYHCDGVCRTDCVLVGFPVAAIRDAIDHDRDTRWAWIDLLSAQSRRQRASMERLALKTVRERVRHLILTEGNHDAAYVLPGTRMELAAELGVSPEALYRTLATLQAQGALTIIGAVMTWHH